MSEPVADSLLEPGLSCEFPQFVERTPLDLTNPLLADTQFSTKFSKRAGWLAVEAEAGHHDASFPGFEFCQEIRKEVLQPGNLLG